MTTKILVSLIVVILGALSSVWFKNSTPYRGPQYFAQLSCDSKYKAGRKPSEQELKQILEQHSEWLSTYPSENTRNSMEATNDRRRANLCGADLTGLREGVLKNVDLTAANLQLTNFIGANLSGANLEFATIEGANFHKAFMDNVKLRQAYGLCVILEENKGWITKLQCTNFQQANVISADLRAVLDGANLSQIFGRAAKLGNLEAVKVDEATLLDSDLSGSYLKQVNLSHVGLENANLNHAHFENVDLTQARLMKVNIEGAVFQGVNFENAQFQPENVRDAMLIGSKGLSTIIFSDPKNLVKLRNLSKESGLRNEQRSLTSALRKFAIKSDTPYERFLQTYIFGGWITDYGADPLRSILVLLCLIPVFSSVYYFFLLWDSASSNIWKVWPADRINRDQSMPIRVTQDMNGEGLLWEAVYFSLLSAFHIGWRDLNVGSWISRLQFREYTVRATGWVRVTSGIQSLVSVYLLALWLLTYFGTPFE